MAADFIVLNFELNNRQTPMRLLRLNPDLKFEKYEKCDKPDYTQNNPIHKILNLMNKL